MARPISLAARTAINAEATGEVWVFLVTVSHGSLPSPLRFSSDPTTRLSEEPLAYGTVSRGETYEFLPLSAVLPDDTDGTPPAIKLVLDNVMRQTVPLLRGTTTPASVTIEMVLAAAPDTVEASFPEFDLVSADYEAGSVSIDLTINALVNEPYPGGTFTPSGFPGLF